MGTISDKLMRIINTKEDIRQALISKGYDVPTSIPFKEYAKMILDLPCKVDSFPDIEGIVARYSASGLTNEQMAANPVWVDKTGNGHDIQLKNLAWGGMSGGQQCGRFAIWELVFLDHDATEEELTKIKDYFVKTYPWLFPDQAWTVVGKTNEDEDRATIANITGNGNNLVLSNFGFAEGSGYGLYKTPFELYPSVQHSSKYSLSFSKFALGDHNLIIAPKQNDLSYDIKVKVTGLKDGVKFKWGWIGITGYIDITTDGIHMLNKPASQIRQLIVEFAEDFDPDHVVTIEQIPEYEGYLVTDGVDDKIISSIFKMGNDWTVIGDWELINTGKNDNAGIVKFDSIVIYNYNYNSMLINIKNGRNILIPDQNTVNAICSDGRIYSKDWKESIYNEETESTSKNFLTIGYSGNAYTKIAFKNLAIYPTVLSREDCIKAYNYLQTLKAK